MAAFVNHLDLSVNPFFTREELDQLARDSGFVKRQSKLSGSLFLDLIVFNSENLKNQSLNDLAVNLQENHGINFTKQSLHERFNDTAVVFLKEALSKLLNQQLIVQPHLRKLEGINRILIKDSICFQVDESMAEDFPDSGGKGSKASVRIQFEYDYLDGSITDMSLNAFNDQDASNAVSTVHLTQKGDLIIRDLAYAGLEALTGVVERSAYYLCRLSPSIHAYELIGGEYKVIDFVAMRNEMKRQGLRVLERQVFFGKSAKFETRLIVNLMPDEEVAERIRKARLNNKNKGRGDLSKEYIARAHLNLFITNTDKAVVPAEKVWDLYRLRWQIELVFKVWKSICDLAMVKKVNKHRLECYIYSKLILIVLGWRVLWKVARRLFSEEGKDLSFYKAFKTLIKVKIMEVRDVFLNEKGHYEEFINDFYELSCKYHLLEKKRTKTSSLEILLGCLNY